MKRVFTSIAAAALSMSLLAGCGGGSNDAANSDVIRIGVNYELSGAVATYGNTSVNGIELAAQEINDAGGINGKKIELVKYDNKSEPAEATTLATRLMTQDKVLAVIGPATSGDFKATLPVANQNKIPVVSGSATADDVTVSNGKLQEYAFRTCFSDSYQGTAMASYAGQNLGAKTAFIMADTSSDYAQGLAASFRDKFESDGGSIVGEEGYVAGDTDFNSVLTRIRDAQFDVLYVPGYYNEVGLIIKQARDLGITKPILGGDGFDSPVLLELAGENALNNVFYTNHYSALDTTNSKLQEFLTNYKAAYNEDPGAFSALGYDSLYFVAKAIENAEEQTPEAVKTAMEQTENFEGVTGTFSIDAETHNPIKEAMVIGLQNGQQATVEKVTA